MNIFNLKKAFQDKKERGWHTLYVLVDAHGTLIRPAHDHIEFYSGAVEVMTWFNRRSDFKVILWTSSHQKEIDAIIKSAEKEGFYFDFINENPLEKNSERACFDRKPYFNILIDDKAGADPLTDWALVKTELIRLGEWDKEA